MTVGDGVEHTRRRVQRAELEGLKLPHRERETDEATPSSIGDILDHFGRYRLLTFDRDPVTRGPTVEVAHEALLHRWGRLRSWLEGARDDIRLQRLLSNAAAEWRASGREAGYLLRGGRLRHFESWAAGSGVALTGEERAYLKASLAARQKREAVLAAQQAREEALRGKSRDRLRYLVGVLATAAVVALVLSLLALSFARQARREARLATSRELAAAAVSNIDVDSERSALLALEGLDTAYTMEAENALHRSVPRMHLLRTLTGHDNALESIAISPDGARFASADIGGWVIVWDVATGEMLKRFSTDGGIILGIGLQPEWRPAHHGQRGSDRPGVG